jgi:hypothetical protein
VKVHDKKVRLGGYVLALFKGLDAWDTDIPALDDFEATLVAGKASDLISSIRALGSVEVKEFEVRRKLARLHRRDVHSVLDTLDRAGLIAVEWSNQQTLVEVKSLIGDRSGVLAAAAAIFEAFSPTPAERIAIEILDLTSRFPRADSEITQSLIGTGFDELDVIKCLKQLEAFQLIAKTLETESARPLIYNPQVFGDDSLDAYQMIANLPMHNKETALKIIMHVHEKPGVPIPQDYDKNIIMLLAKVGIIDLSGIGTRGGTTRKEFPTAPQIWGRFTETGLSEDLIDDSKLLLNSFRYGEFYSPPDRGQIQDPLVLVSRLIDRGQVGAATAIGEDYPMPLARGIVSIVESRIHPGRYFMELRKRDVAEAVRDVLGQGAIVSVGDDILQELPAGAEFTSPEEVRIHKKIPKELIDVRDHLAFELRTHRRQN